MPRPGQIQFLIYPPSKQVLEECGKHRSSSEPLLVIISLRWLSEAGDLTEGAPRAELSKELSEIKAENRKLREELKLKSMLIERQETELYKLRFESFGNVEETGTRAMDAELVKLLRKGHTLSGHEILKELNIDPRDSEAVKFVQNQLQTLQRYELAKESQRGWKWL